MTWTAVTLVPATVHTTSTISGAAGVGSAALTTLADGAGPADGTGKALHPTIDDDITKTAAAAIRLVTLLPRSLRHRTRSRCPTSASTDVTKPPVPRRETASGLASVIHGDPSALEPRHRRRLAPAPRSAATPTNRATTVTSPPRTDIPPAVGDRVDWHLMFTRN